MREEWARTAALIGEENTKRLEQCRIAVFGVGGVGGFAAEALARAGVGNLILVDSDEVHVTNLNRQIIATQETVGRTKVDVLKNRILSINPDANVITCPVFVLSGEEVDLTGCDYIADCIDTVTAKIALVMRAKELGIPIISAMGAGNKLHPELFEIADLSKTSVCPLAKVMRRELRTRGIDHLTVVYSKEEPANPHLTDEETGKRIPASISFVPGVMGMIMAGKIVRDLTGLE